VGLCVAGTRGIIFSSHQDANEIIRKIESAILAQQKRYPHLLNMWQQTLIDIKYVSLP